MKDNLDKQKVEMFTPNHVEMFPAETAQSMFDFRADDVVGSRRGRCCSFTAPMIP